MTSQVVVKRGDKSDHKTRLRVQDFHRGFNEWRDAGIVLPINTDGAEVSQYIHDSRRVILEEYKE